MHYPSNYIKQRKLKNFKMERILFHQILGPMAKNKPMKVLILNSKGYLIKLIEYIFQLELYWNKEARFQLKLPWILAYLYKITIQDYLYKIIIQVYLYMIVVEGLSLQDSISTLGSQTNSTSKEQVQFNLNSSSL